MFLLVALASFLLTQHPKSVATPQNGGEAVWDPCMMWVNYGYMHNLSVLVSFGAFLFFTVRGLRSRSGPRWFALAGLISLIVGVEDTWRETNCGGAISKILICIWYSSVAMVFLHHTIHPSESSADWPQHRRRVGVVYRGVVVAFMSFLLAWFGICQLALLAPAAKRVYVAQLISDIDQKISFPAHLLLLGALALGAYRRIAWSGIAATDHH
jgi:hypothetical protein